MTYHTLAGTTEDILARLLREFSPTIFAEYTGKTPAHFYKVKNPNNNIGLHYMDAVALDRAAKIHLNEQPFFSLFRDLIAEQVGAVNPSNRPTDTLNLGRAYGLLCQAQLEHDMDGLLDPAEADKEIRALEVIENQARTMRQNLIQTRDGGTPMEVVK